MNQKKGVPFFGTVGLFNKLGLQSPSPTFLHLLLMPIPRPEAILDWGYRSEIVEPSDKGVDR